MSEEEEFSNWLKRPEKSLQERVEFALKAWKSAEFNTSRKYELILCWLADYGLKEMEIENMPTAELMDLLRQRAHCGLVSLQIKRKFVEGLLQAAERCEQSGSEPLSRTIPELLCALNDFEVLQDLLRTDYELHGSIYGALLCHYERYLQQFDAKHKSAQVCAADEANFFAKILNSLKDITKRCSAIEQFDKSYCAHIIQPLVQTLIALRKYSLCFFDEFLALERIINQVEKDGVLLDRIFQMPLHVCLLALECAIVCRRNVETFMKLLLKRVFPELFDAQKQHDAGLALMVAAYTLETLRKHDVNLSFHMKKQETALAYLGVHLCPWVKKAKDTHLREVLLLLCAALRFNPLILEQQIFQITTWTIVAAKSAASEEQHLLEEYLVLLIEAFRRLSQTEKFVSNLLKTLKQWLQKYQLPAAPPPESKKRAALNAPSENVFKKRKVSLNDNGAPTESDSPLEMSYLQAIFRDFYKENDSPLVSVEKRYASFPHLQSHWPSATVGVAFSRLITSLVSKPSLVIWKTLLYTLKELVEQLPAEQPLTEKALFQLDLHAALLSQYFAGCKLLEHFGKFSTEVTEQCRFTASVLGQLGRFLLSNEHSDRASGAFLECCYYARCFELQLAYYQPDGMEAATQSANYLNDIEWSLLQQRILSSGQADCEFLFNRLMLQRVEGEQLLASTSVVPSAVSLRDAVGVPMLNGQQYLDKLLTATNAQWFVPRLHSDEKLLIAKALHSSPDMALVGYREDQQTMTFLALHLFEDISVAFTAAAESSLLAALPCNFETLRRCADSSAIEQAALAAIEAINACAESSAIDKLPTELAADGLRRLRELPLCYLPKQSKVFVFVLLLAFYRDLKCTQADKLAAAALDLLTDLLHFGPPIPVFKYFECRTIVKLFPVSQCLPFYDILMSATKSEDSERFLQTLTQLLRESQADGKLTDDERQLMLLAIEALSGMTGASSKRVRKHLVGLLRVYAAYVGAHFNRTRAENAKKDKRFVEKTISSFAAYANAALTQGNATTAEEPTFVVDDQFRRVCKAYIGHSMDYRNPHAVRLMQVALNHRQETYFDQDEIEFVLSNYWRQLNTDLQQHPTQLRAKTTESVVNMIICNKTNEDLLLTLKEIGATLTDKDFHHVVDLLTLVGKCPFSTIKGAIFNEQFKHITQSIILRLSKDERQQFTDVAQVCGLLASQQSLVENKMIPISMDTMDSMLAFLVDINIKRYLVNDSNGNEFKALHLAMTELSSSLIKYRHILLLDRVPQFMHIFKDLMQSVILYKSERQKEAALTPDELNDLAELTHKLEALMRVVGTHAASVKRVAPFTLMFIINLMVTNKRATTLYPKIKTSIDSICYELVGICDHRVGRFILRCSNEAARETYGLLVKNHKKYHKFKGKV